MLPKLQSISEVSASEPEIEASPFRHNTDEIDKNGMHTIVPLNFDVSDETGDSISSPCCIIFDIYSEAGDSQIELLAQRHIFEITTKLEAMAGTCKELIEKQ